VFSANDYQPIAASPKPIKPMKLAYFERYIELAVAIADN
jgi:hypothetical protein